jgi:hypothetical protein
MAIKADGTYAQDHGWQYARDTHGGVSNMSLATVSLLLGVELEQDSQGKVKQVLNNKCFKLINERAAIYNHNGNYRLMVKPPNTSTSGLHWAARTHDET